MQKTLPKGHTSCLSSQFKYTSATHTDVGKTFARIKQQLKRQSEEDRTNVCFAAQVLPDAVMERSRPYTRQRMKFSGPRL